MKAYRFRPCLGLLVFLELACLFMACKAYAKTATWKLDPTSNDWNTPANWTPETVPNGPMQVANFDVSNGTEISLSSSVTVAAMAFSPTASAFSFTTNLLSLDFEGAGVINQSPLNQQFLVPVGSAGGHGMIEFFNRASAGSGTGYTVEGSIANGQAGGMINFWDESSAGSASIDLQGGAHSTFSIGGRAAFMDMSTAGEANITVEPGEDLNFAAGLADVAFHDNSTAGHATLTAKGSVELETFAGLVIFLDESSAEDDTLIADGDPRGSAGGEIEFADASTGGRARVQLFGRGSLLIFLRTIPSVTIGSLEGDGSVSIEKTTNWWWEAITPLLHSEV